MKSRKNDFAHHAKLHDFDKYGDSVQPIQTETSAALVVEMFSQLGMNLHNWPISQSIPEPEILPRHAQLMRRLWSILERLGVVVRKDDMWFRTLSEIKVRPAQSLLDQIIAEFPQHAEEHRLLSVTGPKLADCLAGSEDPIKILFHDKGASDLMGAVYSNAPMFATMTSMLLDVIDQLFPSNSSSEPMWILEIGAGLGGTTAGVLEKLKGSGRKVEYTFTDISPTFVAKARKRFADYDFVKFKVLDVEKDIDTAMEGQFDLILATNVIHATKDLVMSMTHVRKLLCENGSVILSEIINGPDWLDLVWGLLEGWWRFEDGRSYPLQSIDEWSKVFEKAGFGAFTASGGESLESQMQQLLVGSVQPIAESMTPEMSASWIMQVSDVETLCYKRVDRLDLLVDIYWPKQKSLVGKMPIGTYPTIPHTSLVPCTILITNLQP